MAGNVSQPRLSGADKSAARFPAIPAL